MVEYDQFTRMYKIRVDEGILYIDPAEYEYAKELTDALNAPIVSVSGILHIPDKEKYKKTKTFLRFLLRTKIENLEGKEAFKNIDEILSKLTNDTEQTIKTTFLLQYFEGDKEKDKGKWVIIDYLV